MLTGRWPHAHRVRENGGLKHTFMRTTSWMFSARSVIGLASQARTIPTFSLNDWISAGNIRTSADGWHRMRTPSMQNSRSGWAAPTAT